MDSGKWLTSLWSLKKQITTFKLLKWQRYSKMWTHGLFKGQEKSTFMKPRWYFWGQFGNNISKVFYFSQISVNIFNHQKHTTPCNCRGRDMKLASHPFLGTRLRFGPRKGVAPLPPPEGTRCHCPPVRDPETICVLSFSKAHSVPTAQGGRWTPSSYRRPARPLLPPSLSPNRSSPPRSSAHLPISLGSFWSQGSLLPHGTVLWPFWRGIKMESLLMQSERTHASTAIKGSHLLADSWE